MEPENKKRLEELVESISSFINSPIHVIYLGSTKRDLEAINESILENPILSEKDTFELANLKGQRQVLISNLTLFEDAVSNLKARIQAILDEENPISHNDNTDEEI